MSRNLMPKSGAMAPYVVVNRDAAVAGVFSVDGEAGAVVLTSKYLQITKYNTDKAATDAAIKSINDSIGNINTALGGINTTLATKAAKGANNDITELNALTKAITIAQGGTGAKTLENARTNLQVERLRQQDNGTFITSPDGKYSLFIYNSGDFGLIDSASAAVSAMKVAFGGTGGTTPKTARKSLNVPVGALAEIVPDGDNVLNYVAVAGQSGYYSSGELVVNGPPKQEGWWTYNFHCHGVDIYGAAQYGVLRAVGLSGSSWINVLDGTDNWKGWQEQFNLRSTIPVTSGGTGANTAAGARDNLGLGHTQIVQFGGLELVGISGTNSGMLNLKNKNSSNEQVSYSRIYNEVQSGVAKTTIQTTREGGSTNYFQIDENGDIYNARTINASGNIFVTNRLGAGTIRANSQMMIGTENALGDNSIAIGDSDTGVRQSGDGILQVLANGRNIISFDANNMHLNGLLNIWPIENNANGVRIAGTRTGEGNAFIGGLVEAGAFVAWRDRAAGLLVEIPGNDGAVNIFKSVLWGKDWISGMDTIMWSDERAENHLYIRGASYVFDNSGNATAGNWISTSDIRMKAGLQKIDTARDKLKSLVGYTYYKRNTLKEEKDTLYNIEAGVIAQDVQSVLPEAVYKIEPQKEDSMLGVSHAGVNALLVNAVNELNEIVEKQQQEIDELKELVKQLLAK